MTELEIDNVPKILKIMNPTFWKKGRLDTFEHWPFKSKNYQCNPDNMAKAGFYAVGGKEEPDLVECFMCCKQLDGWEPNDDPWQEHKKHQPNCLFIKFNKPDELDLTLIEICQLVQHQYKHKLNLDMEKILEELKRSQNDSAKILQEAYETKKKSRNNVD